LGEEESELQRLILGNMVDGLHIFTQNRTMKPLATALSRVGARVEGEIWWGQSNQWTCNPIQNHHHQSTLYNKNMVNNFLGLAEWLKW
jgi:hypothetical protein